MFIKQVHSTLLLLFRIFYFEKKGGVKVFIKQVHSTLKSLHIYGTVLSLRCHHEGNVLKCKNIGLRAMYI